MSLFILWCGQESMSITMMIGPTTAMTAPIVGMDRVFITVFGLIMKPNSIIGVAAIIIIKMVITMEMVIIMEMVITMAADMAAVTAAGAMAAVEVITKRLF